MHVTLYAETVIRLTVRKGRYDIEEFDLADKHDALLDEIEDLVKAFAKKHRMDWEVQQ